MSTHLREAWRRTATRTKTYYRGISPYPFPKGLRDALDNRDLSAAARLVLPVVQASDLGVWWTPYFEEAKAFGGIVLVGEMEEVPGRSGPGSQVPPGIPITVTDILVEVPDEPPLGYTVADSWTWQSILPSPIRAVAGMTVTSSIQGHLQQMAEMMAQVRPKKDGWKFSSVEELVLHYGRPYTPAPLPEDTCRGEMKMCYSNAMNLVMDTPGLTYVEGFAFSLVMPMGHGWATRDGRTAIDPTWEDGSDYFGIPFTRSFWSNYIQQSGYWGILFPEIPHPAFIDLLQNGLPPGVIA